MSNELIKQKSWWKRNWKWLILINGIFMICMTIFFSSGMNGIATDLH